MKKKLSEFVLPVRLILKAITKVQRQIITWENTNLYYLLAAWHFKIWFGKSLSDEITKSTDLGGLAAKRHAKLVLKKIYPEVKDNEAKTILAERAMGAFQKNILINEEL